MIGKNQESLDELKGLAKTAGVVINKIITHQTENINPAYYLGKGKINYIKKQITNNSVDVIIFDNELSPAQHRNIEDILEIKIIDRTQLILDIFAQHALTKESKLQVELAQLEYYLPRLKGKGIDMSRTGAGIGTRGPGETKLEVDRRRIEKRIHRLKKELKEVNQVRKTQRKNRNDPLVTLIGYTNAGKSTLMNLLTSENTRVEDKLFATLDSKLRSMKLPVGRKIIISDTIGFINKLPHQLIASFKSSLEEIKHSDILIHVIDIEQKYLDMKMRVVNNVLKDMNLENKKIIKVFNKIDCVDQEKIEDLKIQFPDSIAISARTGQGKHKLINRLNKLIKGSMQTVNLNIPYDQANLIDMIYSGGKVLKEEYLEEYIFIKAIISNKFAYKLNKYNN